METETYNYQQRTLLLVYSCLVKLNNPQMGTETF